MNRPINILVENINVYAMLNYLRDKIMEGEDGNWEDLSDDIRKSYIEEAEKCKDYVLTEEEMKAILRLIA